MTTAVPVMSTTTPTSASLPNNLVVVIAGPTGVGKSDVAARLCARHKGIIVSADSVQAYKGVQIGANKPTAEERKETPHILVDVADHTDNYNAAEWRQDSILSIETLSRCAPQQEDADNSVNEHDNNPRHGIVTKAIQDARHEKGYQEKEPLLPIVCGGTMMYLQWLVHGRPDAMKPTETAVNKAKTFMDVCQEKQDYQAALGHVSELGPVFAERTSTLFGEDWYRLRRILEVAYTALEDEDNKDEIIAKLYTGIRRGGLESLGYDVRCFFICPDDRMNHTVVVDQRCEQMLLRGLIKETADLELEGILPEMATRAIGYRQTLDYLSREDTSNREEESFDSFVDDFTTATRRYAKKQMAWFRKDKDFFFVSTPLQESKTDRVTKAAEEITRLVHLSRSEYEKELFGADSKSAQIKQTNEGQGKKMKFYQSRRHLLKEGSDELKQVLTEAIESSHRMKSKRKKVE